MALLMREIKSYTDSEQYETRFYPKLRDKLRLAKDLVNLANGEEGKHGVILFGVGPNKDIIGFREQETEAIIAGIEEILLTISPRVDYDIQSKYDPRTGRNIAILFVKPTLNRFFFPHYVKLSALPPSSIDELVDSSEGTSKSILYNYFPDDEVSVIVSAPLETKLSRLIRIILEIPNSHELSKILAELALNEKIHLDIAYCIFNEIDLEDMEKTVFAFSKLRHLFKLNSAVQSLLETNIHTDIKDLIVQKNQRKLRMQIATAEDLDTILEFLNMSGLAIVPDRLIVEITKDKDYAGVFKQDNHNMNSWESQMNDRILSILQPYIEDKEIMPNHFIPKKPNPKTEAYLKRKIAQQDKIKRDVNRFGRHGRDQKLAILVKELHGFTCEHCGDHKSISTSITVSHRVPLYFGVAFGGIDKSCNMDVLCRMCHNIYERKFMEELESHDIRTREGLFSYLKTKFPENEYLATHQHYPSLTVRNATQKEQVPATSSVEDDIGDSLPIRLHRFVQRMRKELEGSTVVQLSSTDDELLLLTSNFYSDYPAKAIRFRSLFTSLLEVLFKMRNLEHFLSIVHILSLVLPLESKVVYYQAHGYLLQNKYGEAEERFAKAIELNPRNIDAMVEISKLTLRRNDLDATKAWYQAILKLDGPFIDIQQTIRRKLVDLQGTISAQKPKKKNKRNNVKHVGRIVCVYCQQGFIYDPNSEHHCQAKRDL